MRYVMAVIVAIAGIGGCPYSAESPLNGKTRNEMNAISVLNAYASGQIAFRVIMRVTEGHETFLNDYSLLYDTVYEGKKLEFVSKPFADARITASNPVPRRPFSGYVFFDDPGVADWRFDFGLFAIPYAAAGGGIFWIGRDGDVYERKSGDTPGAGMADILKNLKSPLTEPEKWNVLLRH